MNHDKLVEKMLDAYFENEWPLKSRVPGAVERMVAVLDVCVREMLGSITDAEVKADRAECARIGKDMPWGEAFDFVLTARRSRYSKPKSAEERVTVSNFTVYLDGCAKASFCTREDAEIYGLGLIQKLKEASNA